MQFEREIGYSLKFNLHMRLKREKFNCIKTPNSEILNSENISFLFNLLQFDSFVTLTFTQHFDTLI